ncbi:MAG: UDP-3-O-(3-hydroxymyristoyl)glucosamine N-acyltransferase, partial [Deltaproteobacteria bacterium]|nr:UDP-3-O-(3-hydroxymyristoyl)glucosamine N-acyltransferase [Deltaproteobacteria bacterium]
MTSEGYTLASIAERINGRIDGDPGLIVKRVETIEEAGPGDISIVFDARSVLKIGESHASAVVVGLKAEASHPNLIRVPDPRQALIDLLNFFHPKHGREPEIHESAVLASSVDLAPDVTVGAGACISARVTLGAGVAIHPNVYVGEGCVIGAGTEIHPNVTIYEGTQIGKRVLVHGGTVIGSDGFGFFPDASGVQRKIPQTGSVVIEDHVEIGANCTIDRATMGITRICEGAKLDNLVQVGHNTVIGRHCVVVAQVGLAGSVRIGNHCALAGQVGVSDHVTLEDGAMVGARSGVIRDLGPGKWLGTPPLPVLEGIRVAHNLPRLPELVREIKALKKRVSELETLLR